MKKTILIFLCSFILCFVTLSIFAQDASNPTVAESLKFFGIPAFWAGIIAAAITIIGKLIPNKYADWGYYIGSILMSFNKGSKAQEEEKAYVEMKKREFRKSKGLLTIAVLLLLSSSTFAQSPFTGFFNKKSEAIKSFTARSTDTLSTTTTGTLLFRGAATVVGYAVPLKSSDEVSSFQVAGMGLTFGYWTSSTWCKYAVNAFILSTVKLGDLSSSKAGGMATIGLFNNYANIGLMYAAPSGSYAWYVTTGLTYTF